MLDVDGKYAPFFAELKKPAAGICHVWKVTRLDGAVYRFTDHDEEVTVAEGGSPGDEETFTPLNSFSASASKRTQGFPVDNITIIGLIDDGGSPALGVEERDVLGDLFADATVEIWLAVWTNPSVGLLPLNKGTLGPVSFRTTTFEAEMRGLAERLQRPVHRTYTLTCDAVLGDSRCQVELDGSPGFRRNVSVLSVTSNRIFTVDLAEAEQWAQYGKAEFTSGNNAGLEREIIDQTEEGGSPGENNITLLIPMPFDVEAGDTIQITAGCDKTLDTCQTKFDNVEFFRGFPFIPLTETVLETPDAK